MLRLSELGLFLLPFAAFAAWLLLSGRLGRRVLWAVLACFVLLGAATVALGLRRQLAPGDAYAPARLEDGRIVPGHAVR